MWPLQDEDVSDVQKKKSIITSQTFFQSTVNRWLLETIPPQPRYNQHSACWPSRSAAWNECDPRGTAEWGRCEWWECWGGRRGKGSWVGYSDWIGSWWHGSCWIMKWCWLILYLPSVTLHDQKENNSQQAMPHAGQQEIRITGTTLDQKIGSQTWLPKNACHPTNQSDPDRRKSVGFFLVRSGLKFPSWSYYMTSITTKISNSWAPHTSPNSAGDWEQP